MRIKNLADNQEFLLSKSILHISWFGAIWIAVLTFVIYNSETNDVAKTLYQNVKLSLLNYAQDMFGILFILMIPVMALLSLGIFAFIYHRCLDFDLLNKNKLKNLFELNQRAFLIGIINTITIGIYLSYLLLYSLAVSREVLTIYTDGITAILLLFDYVIYPQLIVLKEFKEKNKVSFSNCFRSIVYPITLVFVVLAALKLLSVEISIVVAIFFILSFSEIFFRSVYRFDTVVDTVKFFIKNSLKSK